MTEVVFAIIDNHRIKRGTKYNIIFKTKNLKEFEKYIRRKGIK